MFYPKCSFTTLPTTSILFINMIWNCCCVVPAKYNQPTQAVRLITLWAKPQDGSMYLHHLLTFTAAL